MTRSLSARSPDAKRATHDGYIWPNNRDAMTDAAAIQARMIEDALDFEDTHGTCDGIDEAYFRRRGWSKEQITANAPQAVSSVTAHRNQPKAA